MVTKEEINEIDQKMEQRVEEKIFEENKERENVIEGKESC